MDESPLGQPEIPGFLQIRCTAPGLSGCRIEDFIKARLFLAGDCCFRRMGWRSQRQSEKKSKVRNACVLPVRAKCRRFCVLTNGRTCIRTVGYLSFGLQQQSALRVGRTEVRSTRFVCHKPIPCSGKRNAGSAAGSPHNSRSLPRGSQDTRSYCCSRVQRPCPPQSSRQESILLRGIVLTVTISR